MSRSDSPAGFSAPKIQQLPLLLLQSAELGLVALHSVQSDLQADELGPRVTPLLQPVGVDQPRPSSSGRARTCARKCSCEVTRREARVRRPLLDDLVDRVLDDAPGSGGLQLGDDRADDLLVGDPGADLERVGDVLLDAVLW